MVVRLTYFFLGGGHPCTIIRAWCLKWGVGNPQLTGFFVATPRTSPRMKQQYWYGSESPICTDWLYICIRLELRNVFSGACENRKMGQLRFSEYSREARSADHSNCWLLSCNFHNNSFIPTCELLFAEDKPNAESGQSVRAGQWICVIN